MEIISKLSSSDFRELWLNGRHNHQRLDEILTVFSRDDIEEVERLSGER